MLLYPSRSRLISLRPEGVGTPNAESAPIYITRLAKEHSVLPSDLLNREILELSAGSALNAWIRNNGLRVQQVIDSLEAKTLRDDIRCLTMLPYSPLLGKNIGPRAFRAWCPECLQEMKNNKKVVYELLAWSLSVVTCCPVHKVPLQAECNICESRVSADVINLVPGVCRICRNWLGNTTTKKGRLAVSEEELWRAKTVGMMIANAPKVNPELLREHFRLSLLRAAEHRSQVSLASLGRLYNGDRNSVEIRLDHFICLDTLLNVIRKLEIPIEAILFGCEWKEKVAAREEPLKSAQVQRPIRELRKLMVDQYENGPAVSLTDVAHCLGYARTHRLRVADPELCERIWEKFRKHGANESRQPLKRSDVIAVLKKNLDSERPLPLSTVANQLGYKSSRYCWVIAPEICRATGRKIGAPFVAKKKKAIKALRDAIKSSPPIRITEVSRATGMSIDGLHKLAPELARALSKSCKEYRRDRMFKIDALLSTFLGENPPLSMSEIVKRTGLDWKALHLNHKELVMELSRGYREYQNRQNETKANRLYAGVSQLIRKMQEREEKITFAAVASEMNRGSRKFSQPRLKVAFDRAVGELDIIRKVA